MDHPPAHRQGVGHDLIGQADAAQGVEAALGDRQVDRPTALGLPGARVGTALVHRHREPRRAEEAREQAAGEPAADDGDLVGRRLGHDVARATSVERFGGAPAVVVRGVQRHRGEADDVGLARVGDHAVLVRAAAGRRSAAPATRTDSWAPRRSGSRGVTISSGRATLVEQRLQVTR